MDRLLELARRLTMLLHRRQFDADLEEEMRLHLELRQQEHLESGMTADDARAAARRRFGNATYLKEESHIAWGWEWLDHVAQDLRYGLRMLRKSPGFTGVAALILALGIGANSAIFSVMNGILLKPLPYSHPNELIDLNHTAPGVNFPDADPAPFLYFTYREQGRAFQSLGLYRWDYRSVTGLTEPEEAQCLNVTAEVLPMLGVQPELGRWFSEAGATPAVWL
jgi:MacB-like periplasmic core domain